MLLDAAVSVAVLVLSLQLIGVYNEIDVDHYDYASKAVVASALFYVLAAEETINWFARHRISRFTSIRYLLGVVLMLASGSLLLSMNGNYFSASFAAISYGVTLALARVEAMRRNRRARSTTTNILGINKTLNPENAREIYDECNEQIKNDAKFTPRGLMKHYNVKVVCTTDDPVDTLEYHKQVAADATMKTKMLPTWRPDKAMAVEVPANFKAYVDKLSDVSGKSINNFNDYIDAIQARHDFFASMGCKLSDHGIEEFYAEDYTDAEIKAIFDKVYGGKELTQEEILKFKSAMMHIFGVQDAEAGWAQQFHYGAIRDNNSKMFKLIGPDTGFDSIGEFNTAKKCSKFLDKLNAEGKLAKTILYNLNPCANEVLATMLGNFQDGSIPGKIQWGSGWWFLDQKDGMTKQMNALSLLGLLSRFVGMLTDSRSFLSYPRHEYFRRILCNLVATDIENGEVPYTGYEAERVNQMIEDISYNNAKNYFQF